MKTKLILLCLFFFSIVTNADRLATLENDLDVVDWPSECEKMKSENCALKTHEIKKYNLKREGLHIVLSERSILKVDHESIHLIKGEFLVLKNKKYEIKSSKIKSIESQSPFVIQLGLEETEIYALNGHLTFETNGDGESLKLLPATSIKIGAVTEKGYLKEFPKLTLYKRILKKMSRLYPFSAKDYRVFVSTYRHNWGVSSKKIGELYELNAITLIENQKNQDLRRKLARKRRAQERAALKNLFMRKNYID